VVEAVGEKALVYGGICDSGVTRMLENAARMKSAGAHAVVATGPYYLSKLPSERERELLGLIERSPLPILLYDIPEFVGYSFRPEWIGDLADHPNLVGYKDSTNDWDHHCEVLDRTRNKDFSVWIGKELLLAKALCKGASGLVVSLVHANPEAFVELAESARNGHWEQVRVAQQRIAEIVDDFLVSYREQPVFSTLLRYLGSKMAALGIHVRLLLD
jgi:4-hydroxy-tetrahydrodipicolinate synthase